MTYRIELLFVGEAPESEMERARIMGAPAVQEKIDLLKHELADQGLETIVEFRTVRPGKRPKASGRPKLATAE